jgi:hypothetical protein
MDANGEARWCSITTTVQRRDGSASDWSMLSMMRRTVRSVTATTSTPAVAAGATTMASESARWSSATRFAEGGVTPSWPTTATEHVDGSWAL